MEDRKWLWLFLAAGLLAATAQPASPTSPARAPVWLQATLYVDEVAVVGRTVPVHADLFSETGTNATLTFRATGDVEIRPTQQRVRIPAGGELRLEWNLTVMEEGFWSIQLVEVPRLTPVSPGVSGRGGFSGLDDGTTVMDLSKLGERALEFNVTVSILDEDTVRVAYREGLREPWAHFMEQTTVLAVPDSEAPSGSSVIAIASGPAGKPPSVEADLPLAEGETAMFSIDSAWTNRSALGEWKARSCPIGQTLRRSGDSVDLGLAPRCRFGGVESPHGVTPVRRILNYSRVPWDEVGPIPGCRTSLECGLIPLPEVVPDVTHQSPGAGSSSRTAPIAMVPVLVALLGFAAWVPRQTPS